MYTDGSLIASNDVLTYVVYISGYDGGTNWTGIATTTLLQAECHVQSGGILRWCVTAMGTNNIESDQSDIVTTDIRVAENPTGFRLEAEDK